MNGQDSRVRWLDEAEDERRAPRLLPGELRQPGALAIAGFAMTVFMWLPLMDDVGYQVFGFAVGDAYDLRSLLAQAVAVLIALTGAGCCLASLRLLRREPRPPAAWMPSVAAGGFLVAVLTVGFRLVLVIAMLGRMLL